MSSDPILYRRQFILGNAPISNLPGWKINLFASYYLTIHPDLETTLAKGSTGEFIMLGFALNHSRPEASNQDLMDEIARTCHNVEELFEYCRDLCGRYVIAFAFPGKTGLLTDLIGSRSVYFTIYQGNLWCASQPSTLAHFLKIEEDCSPDVRAYIEQDMFSSGEGCWIGDGTKYLGVSHLLPNHYLNFEEKKPVRYWPTSAPGTLDIENAVSKSAAILESTMRAATNRFQMSMAVTSGWDSRCMLAATRKVSSKIYYYIQQYGKMTENHPDIRIPRKLARKCGFPFQIINCTDYKDEAFDAALEGNVFLLHNPSKKALLWNFYKDFQGKVNASGNISDLCRTIYGIEPVYEIEDLLAPVHLSHSEYAVNSLKDWFPEAKRLCDYLGYNLRDLFFWEQTLSNWGSMFAAELDIAVEEFYPFGTRRLIETILAVDGKLRPYQNSSVHRKMIQLLWPELLSEPINPTPWQTRAISSLRKEGKSVLSRLGLLNTAKALRTKLSIR